MLNHKSSLVTAKNYAKLDYSHVDAWGGSTRQLQAPAVLVSKMPKPTVAAGPFVARMKKGGASKSQVNHARERVKPRPVPEGRERPRPGRLATPHMVAATAPLLRLGRV